MNWSVPTEVTAAACHKYAVADEWVLLNTWRRTLAGQHGLTRLSYTAPLFTSRTAAPHEHFFPLNPSLCVIAQ